MILAQPQPVPSLCLLLLLRKLQLNRDSSGKSKCLSKELLLSPHVARTLHISKEQHLHPCPMQASAWIRASQKLQPLLDARPEITELSPPLAFSSRHKPRQESAPSPAPTSGSLFHLLPLQKGSSSAAARAGVRDELSLLSALHTDSSGPSRQPLL